MKKLVLIRHAKAASAFGGSDFDRSLTDEGRADMGRFAPQLDELDITPSLILCSPAKRTRATLSLLLGDDGESVAPVNYDQNLYEVMPGDLYEALKKADDNANTLWLVSHNPGMHGLAAFLAKDDGGPDYNQTVINYTPGTVTVLSCPCENWSGLIPNENQILHRLVP